MFRCHLDHLVVTAPTLDSGTEYVEQSLGVRLQPGGEHELMGTHNRLLRLGEDSYLEVIAVNPRAPAPARARWFGLDQWQPGLPPRLATWVARTDHIQAVVDSLAEELGPVCPMTRGALRWLITIPLDGLAPLGGIAPTLIEWQSAHHPARNLEPAGCTLLHLQAFHPDPERATALIRGLGLHTAVEVMPGATPHPHLVAHIDTPRGPRILGGMTI